jgi:hypothetical protein
MTGEKMMRRLYRYTPGFIIFFYVLIFIFVKNPSVTWDKVINSDGKGYYAYLPALFIYHDLDFRFIESYEDKYYPADKQVFKEFRVNINGGIVDKYFPGLAILWLPFFLIAHFLSIMTGQEADGYSILYQYGIFSASLFYLWIGCRFLLKLLMKINPVEKLAAITTLVIGLGTNIIYYVIIEGSMCHVYSFSMITLFLYTTFNLYSRHDSRWFIISAILFSLIVLIRPVNGLVIILVPFVRSLALIAIADHGKKRYSTLDLLSGVAFAAMIFAIPMVLWHHQTGQWLVYSYGNEHLILSDPHFFSILFSYNRGWFVYTPVVFVSLAGLPSLYGRSRPGFCWLAAFLIVFIYITSSWWSWYYASKFGQRIFIDILALPGILLFFLLLSIERFRIPHKGLKILLVLLIGLNLVQFYQHSRWIFPSTDIDRRTYWNSFFSFHVTSSTNIPLEAVTGQKTMFNNMENSRGWINEGTIRGIMAFSPSKSSVISRIHPYSVGISAEIDTMFTTTNKVIRVVANVFSLGSVSGASIICNFIHSDTSMYYRAFYIEPFARPGEWTRIETAYYVPSDLAGKSIVRIYFFLPSSSVPLFIDDLKIDFLSLKEDRIYTRLEGVLLPQKQ